MSNEFVDIKARERLSHMEAKVDGLEDKVVKIDSNTELIHKMNTLLEVQIAMSKNSDKKMEAFEKVVEKVNDNLTMLNSNHEGLKNTVNIIKLNQDNINNEFKEMESKVDQISSKGKFDVVDFLTNKVTASILFAIIAAVLALVGIKL